MPLQVERRIQKSAGKVKSHSIPPGDTRERVIFLKNCKTPLDSLAKILYTNRTLSGLPAQGLVVVSFQGEVGKERKCQSKKLLQAVRYGGQLFL